MSRVRNPCIAVSLACRGAALLIGLALVAGASSACSSHDGRDADADAGGNSGGNGDEHDRFYVTMAGTNEVWSFDDETHEVLSKISVGQGPAIVLATPDHKQLYTANWADSTVSAIDIGTEEVTSIAVPGRPYVIAMAPDGDRVYAGLQSNQIAVIDTATREIEEFFATTELPASVIVSADGELLYIAGLAGRLSAVHASDGSAAAAGIGVGSAPAWITISPDGKKIYTLNFLSDDVSIVDTEAWSVVGTVPTGAGSQAIIGNVTSDNAMLYVTNYGTGELMGIDAVAHEVTQTVKLDGRPVGVNLNSDASRVYVTDFGPESLAQPANSNFLLTGMFGTTDDGQVSVYDRDSGELIDDVIVVAPGPTSVVFVPR